MRALFRRHRRVQDVTLDEARGVVCDAACRAAAAVDRSRTSVLRFR
ncbi:hypothetical protein GCM10010404_50060 [Nonomuraea africana]|uniref:Uncharacterized protein n=1 Tax=Nonomuraea africana TaxID=46171 RepID=A0ABR9KVF9_9ACTN|nr:hypothetical protein [Nonomuraea africana]MBE1566026.1 hypothetical protein [Nonomuraea africana]